MKQLFIVNPETLSNNLVKIMIAMGGTIGYDEFRCNILLELELASSNLPCHSSRLEKSGFSISQDTLFWGLQWIGSLDWIKHTEKGIPFLSFARAGASIDCLNEHYKTLPTLPPALPKVVKASSNIKLQGNVGEFKYSTDNVSLFSIVKPIGQNKNISSTQLNDLLHHSSECK